MVFSFLRFYIFYLILVLKEEYDMNNLKSITYFLFFIVLLVGCNTNGSDPIVAESINAPNTEMKIQSPNTSPTNPNAGYYDIIVEDIDRWEICLNIERARYHVNSYTGHMWYQMGSFVFEGPATAMYNNKLDILTVYAADSGWDRGHILYALKFEEDNSNDMYGSFVYYEYPRRTNGIDAWLIKGTLGNHTADLRLAKKEDYEFPLIHAKKERYDLEND
jgi:hypothetical protein